MDVTNAQYSNIFDFATEQARSIVYLHYVDLIVCFSIFIIVASLLTIVAVKFRAKPGDPEPYQNVGNTKLEITWTVIPLLILLGLGVGTGLVMNSVNPPLKPEDKPDVIVVAHQWWWEYRYPKTGVVTANELYLPVGVNTLIEMRSADVVHSYWVPDFGQKMDCIPGHPNHISYKPLRTGVFTGACSEFCGADHALMRILVKVLPQAEYDEWTRKQLHVPTILAGAVPVVASHDDFVPPSKDTSPERGQQIFMTETCMQCHAIAGTKARGLVGPDLTHLADRQTIGSVLVPNTLENTTKWIMNPQTFKPGCHMPNMRLSDADARALATYLENLK